MEKLGFNDIFDFLAVELGKSAKDLRALAAASEGVERLAAILTEAAFTGELHKLTDPLMSPGESTPLIASDVTLTQSRIKSLINRQLKYPESPIGPLNIAPDEAVMGHYRALLRSHFSQLASSLSSNPSQNIRQLHTAINTVPKLNELQDDYSKVLDLVLASPEAVARILPSLSGGKRDGFAESVDASLCAMALRVLCGILGMSHPHKSELLELGMAALLQDVGAKSGMKEEEDPDHPERSAQIAREMGANDTIVELVKNHHRLTNEIGAPLFNSGALISEAEATLISTNAILSELRTNSTGHSFEIAKNLHHLARMGFLDVRVVKAFTRLFLPKIQAVIIEKAEGLKDACALSVNNPILWPVSGGKAPSVFICRHFDCEYATPQISRLATDIPFKIDGRVIAVITKGEYFTCPLLTKHLKTLYQRIQEQLDQEVK